MHLVFTTVAKKKDADKIAGALISLKLAACVSSWPINSTYRWMGKIKREKEYAIEIKTAKAGAVRKWLEKNHPYKLPVIYSLKADGISPKAKKWICGKQV
ncbi:Divalent-cation tolerance protein CutA [uncultured archaeon]|nr:Divalent-cation tolerance protein CutA [uncultured archaeon]